MKKTLFPLTLEGLEKYFKLKEIAPDAMISIEHLAQLIGCTLIHKKKKAAQFGTGIAGTISCIIFKNRAALDVSFVNGIPPIEVDLTKDETSEYYILAPEYIDCSVQQA